MKEKSDNTGEKNSLVNSSNSAIKNISIQIELFKDLLSRIDPMYSKAYLILSSCLRLDISMRDMLISFRELINLTIDYEKNLQARVLALQIYEFLGDFQKTTNGKFKNQLNITNSNDNLKIYKSLKKECNKIIDEFSDLLYNIRNKTIAHKEKSNINDLIKAIDEIDDDRIGIIFTYIMRLYYSFCDLIQVMLPK